MSLITNAKMGALNGLNNLVVLQEKIGIIGKSPCTITLIAGIAFGYFYRDNPNPYRAIQCAIFTGALMGAKVGALPRIRFIREGDSSPRFNRCLTEIFCLALAVFFAKYISTPYIFSPTLQSGAAALLSIALGAAAAGAFKDIAERNRNPNPD